MYPFDEWTKYILPSVIPGDFVYLDPPYHPANSTSNFTEYNANGFSGEDQIAVRNAFRKLRDRGIKAMVSNSDCEFIRDLYAGFDIHEIQRSGAINSKASSRGKVTELAVTNY